jgi:hypothetical protein
MDHVLFHCTDTSAQLEILIQQVHYVPTTKQDPIVKYQKQFSAFVESIDFETLQQSAQQP